LYKSANFDISEIKFQKLLDHSTALVLFKICTSGDNKHELPFSKEALIEAAESSLRGKPIVAKYDAWEDDFGTHHPTLQIPLGYFVEHQEFNYVDNEDGTCSLFAYGVLWKDYAPKQYEVFVKKAKMGESPKKSASMEIFLQSVKKGWCQDKDKTELLKFSFKGVTIIGDKYTPASPGAFAKMVSFASIKKTETEKYFTVNSDKIKTKDSHSLLLKYYGEMGLPMENFAEKEDEKMKDKSEDVVLETEEVIDEPTTEEVVDSTKAEEFQTESVAVEDTQKEEEVDYAAKCTQMSTEIGELKSDNQKLKIENETYLSDVTELKEFKFAKLEAEKLLKIEEAFSIVSDILPKEVILDYRNRIDSIDFLGVDGFCNEIKSRVVDFVELKAKDAENKFAIQKPTTEPKKKNFW